MLLNLLCSHPQGFPHDLPIQMLFLTLSLGIAARPSLTDPTSYTKYIYTTGPLLSCLQDRYVDNDPDHDRDGSCEYFDQVGKPQYTEIQRVY